MDERHLMNALMRAVVGEKSEYLVRPYFSGMRKFAAYAFVAEQYGYRYMGHAPGNAALNNPYFVFRRTSDARERVAATMGGHADRNAMPGMLPGRGFTPDSAARPWVDLFYSQMIVDAAVRHTPRVLSNILLYPVVAAIFLFFPGYTVGRVLFAGGIWATLIALFLVGRVLTRRRCVRHLARLAAAGVEWPPRET